MCVGFRQRYGKAVGAVGCGLPNIYRAALRRTGCSFFDGIGVVFRAQLRQRYGRLGAALRAGAGQRSDGGNGRRGRYGIGIAMLTNRLELPCGLDGLHAVRTVAFVVAAAYDRALPGVCILGGDDHGEGDKVFARLCNGVVVAVLCITRVVAVVLFHSCGGFCNGAAVFHCGPKVLFVFVVAGEGDGLGVAVNDLDALFSQRRINAVRRHAEANWHPKHTVRGVFRHVVGNYRTVHAVDRAAATSVTECVLVSPEGACDGFLIFGGQPGARRQRKVGGVRLGNAVIDIFAGIVGVFIAQRLVVVRDAVGVKDHDSTVLHCLCNAGNGCLCAGQSCTGAAGRLGNALTLGFVLIGEVGVGIIPRTDDIDVLTGGRAAPLGIGDGFRRALRGQRDILRFCTQGGEVALRLAVGILPKEVDIRAVVGAGALDVVVGSHDHRRNVGGERRVIRSGRCISHAARPTELRFFVGENLVPKIRLLRSAGKAAQQRQQHGGDEQDN